MRLPLILAALVALTLSGCNEEQIARAQAIADAGDARMAQADQAFAIANQALAKADALATQLGSEKGSEMVADAKAAVDAAGAARDVAKVASTAAHAAVDAATNSQKAGASTLAVLIAALTAAVPTIGTLALAVSRLYVSYRGFRQTIAGIEDAKTKMPADQVAVLHASLASAQDDQTKVLVAVNKAA